MSLLFFIYRSVSIFVSSFKPLFELAIYGYNHAIN